MKKITHIIGIDEVGRGPLAGPVTLGAVLMKKTAYEKFQHNKKFSGLKDSKKLTETKREEWRGKILEWKKEGTLDFAVCSSSAATIDSKGLSFAISSALARCLKKLGVDPTSTLVLLDGGLKAPAEFLYQQTIIKGDEKEPIISLASVIAKTTRDRKMKVWAKVFPAYGFEIHKGYGTLAHRKKIHEVGKCKLHRSSFLSHI